MTRARSSMTSPSSTPEEDFIFPTGGALGAEVRGVDLSQPLSESEVATIRRALLDHFVLLFPGQRITDEELVRFTSYFGRPVEHVRQQRDRPVKEIFFISNVRENGELIGALGNEEVSFHSDLSYLPQPGTLSLLYAVEVPSSGGDTHWCNCCAAYEALGAAAKDELKGLRALHRHYVDSQNPLEPVTHPVVCTHPDSGRRALYVGPHLTKSIVGMPSTDSDALLQRLYDHLSQPRFIWTHSWCLGDLIMWDNRPTMHRRDAFPDTERRVMKRTQVFNDEVPVE
ncbi:MAG TPA: TauD/TfdA family dioxygenase [Candidatus Latescibacteria bacterium]|nr:TauD/TfdA family dioxygenase [Candidatus Latescibacterota bacterium]HIM57158.1 TauD/TfdA family dioxygenase [Candidatus Latescibacterota bacterium]